MIRRAAVVGVLVCAILASSRSAYAGLGDIIWEMSGPMMVGVTIRCRVPFDNKETECWLSKAARGTAEQERMWLSLEGGAYFSTGVNNGGTNYRAFEIGMFTFEPMVERLISGNISEAYKKRSGKGAVFFGVGPLINHFVVSGSGAFTKVGIKLRPLAIVYSRWALEYNIRIYDDRFTPDEFGFGPRMPNDRKFEFVQSIGISIPFLTWKLMH